MSTGYSIVNVHLHKMAQNGHMKNHVSDVMTDKEKTGDRGIAT